MNFGERLTELRISNGYSKRNEFADKLGIPSTTLRNYEIGVREPGHTFLKQISEIFNVSVDYLLGLTDEKEVLNSFRLKTTEYDHIKKYRLISDQDPNGKVLIDSTIDYLCDNIKQMHNRFTELTAQAEQIIELKKAVIPKRFISYYQRLASAGSGEYLFDSIPTDTIEVPENSISKQADFVIGVNGHSMEPTYNNGDKVYVQISKTIPIGSIGIFTRGNDCFIKELGHDRLISHNSNKKIYPDIPASNDIRCVGLVLGKVTNI